MGSRGSNSSSLRYRAVHNGSPVPDELETPPESPKRSLTPQEIRAIPISPVIGKPCCFHWCCCCPCSSTKGGTPKSEEAADKEKVVKPAKPAKPDKPPTLEEIRLWGQSFDALMSSPAGRELFKGFLQCEYSEENILFWQACEDLKAKTDGIQERARMIYEDFISILSPKEVSLDAKVREMVNDRMVNDLTNHVFDEAQSQIYTLMHRDSYPRFVNSQLYKQKAQLTNTTQPSTPVATEGPSGSGITRKISLVRKKSSN